MVAGCDEPAEYRIEYGNTRKLLYVCEDCYENHYKEDKNVRTAEKHESIVTTP